MAYGVHPAWAEHSWGLGLIMLTRRFQWPLVALSLILCLALLVLVVACKRRAWWLIALAPVLALFGHRFLTAPINRYAIADHPQFLTIAEATFLRDEDPIIGLVFKDQACAYALSALDESPVVVQSDREHRLMVMWSPKADVASAFEAGSELKARDLDITSEPANGLLIYHNRRGEFISAITGLRIDGQKPRSFESRVPVTKTTWGQWKQRWPDSRVMMPLSRTHRPGPRPSGVVGPDQLLTLIGQSSVVAIPSKQITADPMNLSAGGQSLLVFRDDSTGQVRAFDRRIEADLIPRFTRNTDRRRKAALVDSDTGSGWTLDGRCIDGDPQFKGKRLAAVAVQENIARQVADFWYRNRIVHIHAP